MGRFTSAIGEGIGQGLGIIIIFVIILALLFFGILLFYKNASFETIATDMIKKALNL